MSIISPVSTASSWNRAARTGWGRSRAGTGTGILMRGRHPFELSYGRGAGSVRVSLLSGIVVPRHEEARSAWSNGRNGSLPFAGADGPHGTK